MTDLDIVELAALRAASKFPLGSPQRKVLSELADQILRLAKEHRK